MDDAMEVIISPQEDRTLNSSDYLRADEAPTDDMIPKLSSSQNKNQSASVSPIRGDESGVMLLKNVTAKDIQKDIHSLTWLKPEHSIEHALTRLIDLFQLMSSSKSTFAPVYDANVKDFIGLVDNHDLSMFMLMAFGEQYKLHPHLYDPKEIAVNFAKPVSQFINVSRQDQFIKVSGSEDLYSTIKIFLEKGVHRVAVTDAQGAVTGMISSHDIIVFIRSNLSMFPTTGAKRIEEIPYPSNMGVLQVSNQDTLAKAFMALLQYHVSGLAVVDSVSGTIVDNVSASDLRGIDAQSFYKLEAPIHQLYTLANRGPPIVCNGGHTIQQVLDDVITRHVRRVYVVDEQNKPKRVISHSDLLGYFVASR
ncbi:hypothetical protein PROFUN_11172 [Planoprotostelium fungivorum]|uniref:CBS domain-containing protein n=1 Tax=Planoprotostelium fungivorum TaxID=1890364 RepID=A0A2P6NAP3_9EUKA|nr:hypothetical protein PROFUN_11172 [Planoprotostelium fungivorum]